MNGPPQPPRRVVAVGDSITHGGDGRLLGVPARSWAAWLAEALGARLCNLAEPGALAADVLARQLPRAGQGHALACVYVGVNDVRGTGWDATAFERELSEIASVAAERAERVLIATIPLTLGRPPAGPKVADANAIVRRAAARHGAAVVDLAHFDGWPLVFPDRVHPTPLGQLEIAERAAAELAAAGLPVPRRPGALAQPSRSPYARAHLGAVRMRESARDLLRLMRESPAWTVRTAAGRR